MTKQTTKTEVKTVSATVLNDLTQSAFDASVSDAALDAKIRKAGKDQMSVRRAVIVGRMAVTMLAKSKQVNPSNEDRAKVLALAARQYDMKGTARSKAGAQAYDAGRAWWSRKLKALDGVQSASKSAGNANAAKRGTKKRNDSVVEAPAKVAAPKVATQAAVNEMEFALILQDFAAQMVATLKKASKTTVHQRNIVNDFAKAARALPTKKTDNTDH